MTAVEPAWGVLTVRLAARCVEVASHELAESTDSLEALGAIVAADDDVGGVELRDRTTLEGAEMPELWVFSRVEALPRLQPWIEALAVDLGLEVALEPRIERGEAWRDAWKTFYGKQTFGDDRLLLRPSWIERGDGDPELEVVLDPGRAFGTGLHETTRLTLELLCRAAASGATAHRVADLGSGSGVLGLAMARLWPTTTVVAVDVDPDAAEVTRENVALNRLDARIEVGVGSVAALGAIRFDVIAANVRTEVLIPCASQLIGLLEPEGRLVLSGILDGEASAIVAAYGHAGGRVLAEAREGGWIAIAIARRGAER